MAIYEWDEDKNQKNLAKHGFSFKDAGSVFAGSCVTYRDRRFDYGEEQFISLGLLEGRIISMRKANRREQKAYTQQPETD